ncbi:MAG: 3-phosphoshikimate 1-carboxyvinyltransferase [Xanthomonadales bacterium]|nr:3-phosphoshikimate 1-carboxyvinyltransferase [Xanthomonadales bacterium]
MILRTNPCGSPLLGELTPPGDKSISHRALILSCLARGQSRVQGLLDAADVRATADACRQLGMQMRTGPDGALLLDGVGADGLSTPAGPLDMGNSGTAMRLLAGVLAAQPFSSELTGDASLSRRPMRRIVQPLTMMGAVIETAENARPPLRIRGNPALTGIDYVSPVASAQVKSCLLLAGLYAAGRTTVTEPRLSRDHTEKMLPSFGVELLGTCGVRGGSRLSAASIRVPADISSAAFFLAAACLVPGSDLLLRDVGLNATRDGVIDTLRAMGAKIDVGNRRLFGEEPVGDLHVRYAGRLQGIDIPVERVPALIDELPVIMALAAACEGCTRLRGAAELRVKESDRLAVMAAGLSAMGVSLREYEDGIDIEGGPIHAADVNGAGDHRCAMSFCVLGQVAPGPLRVAGAEHIGTSYPGFVADLTSVGGAVRELRGIQGHA